MSSAHLIGISTEDNGNNILQYVCYNTIQYSTTQLIKNKKIQKITSHSRKDNVRKGKNTIRQSIP